MVRRWLNEYLDGEIGLADKAELERLMAEDKQLRQEYKELRRIGLLLGSIAEVSVHPQRFRQKVMGAIEAQERSYFTPQRAFASAMLVALIVVGLTFGLFVYQQKMLAHTNLGSTSNIVESTKRAEQALALTLTIDATPEKYFSRLLDEYHLGMVDNSLVNPLVQQTSVFEGAVCTEGLSLRSIRFPKPLPRALRVRVTPWQALTLKRIAEGVSTQNPALWGISRDGRSLGFDEFMQEHPGAPEVILRLEFAQ